MLPELFYLTKFYTALHCISIFYVYQNQTGRNGRQSCRPFSFRIVGTVLEQVFLHVLVLFIAGPDGPVPSHNFGSPSPGSYPPATTLFSAQSCLARLCFLVDHRHALLHPDLLVIPCRKTQLFPAQHRTLCYRSVVLSGDSNSCRYNGSS